jgi:Na+-driven multidrug efflux pump
MSYCMEGWAVEVLIFLSGMLKNADVAVGVTGLSLQFSTFVWLAAASIGSATSTRVANKVRGAWVWEGVQEQGLGEGGLCKYWSGVAAPGCAGRSDVTD